MMEVCRLLWNALFKPRVLSETVSLSLCGRGKVVYIAECDNSSKDGIMIDFASLLGV